MKIYVVLKSSDDASLTCGVVLGVACVCASEEKAYEVINNARENLLAQGWEETECNIALAMYNPLNELEYQYFEIQEIDTMEVNA